MGATAARLERVRAELVVRELDCLLVTNSHNIRYLTGFTGTAGTVVVGHDSASLLTDFRYVEQARAEVDGYAVLDGGSKPREMLADQLIGRVGFDPENLTVAARERIENVLADGVELVGAVALVEDMRVVKSADELDLIAQAAAIADEIYRQLADGQMVGRTESEVAWQIETLARELGGEGCSFPPIVASGPHGALPHASPRSVAIEPDTLVVLDLGVVVDGYCSDATRTFATGKLSQTVKDVYDLVLRAQLAALDAAAPNVSAADVDAAARDVIANAGHGDQFGHGTGHGVGLEVHEAPRLGASSKDILTEGSVVTIEPGIYIPGEFGVRIEDLVVVTDAGTKILSQFPKGLLTVA